MLAATGFTLLLVNIERMTSKPKAGGACTDCVAWKVEKAVHYFFMHVTTDSSTDTTGPVSFSYEDNNADFMCMKLHLNLVRYVVIRHQLGEINVWFS